MPTKIVGSRQISELTDDERREVAEAYAKGESTNLIAEVFDIKWTSEISKLATQLGVPLRKPRGPNSKSSAKPPLDERIAEAKAKLEELLAEKASRSISFELYDETSVIVRGVTEDFLRLEGMAKFRDWLSKRVPQKA